MDEQRYTGYISMFAKGWVVPHRETQGFLCSDVGDWLKESTIQALRSEGNLIWILWPYYDPDHRANIRLCLAAHIEELMRQLFVIRCSRVFRKARLIVDDKSSCLSA